MILVDTSVLIDYLKGTQNAKTELFEMVLRQELPYGIAAYTYQEVLQGARTEAEFSTLRSYLGSQKIYSLPEDPQSYEDAARLYFDLRRKGVTIRSTIDILIARTAIFHGLYLLHNDRDFDVMADAWKDLKSLDRLL